MGAGLAARAVAPVARAGSVEVEGLGDAERGLDEVELHRPPRRPARAADRPAPPPNRPGEERVEQVAEPERLAAAAAAAPRPVVAEHVVAAAPLGVAQRLVRDRDLLEVRLGRGVARVRVRVQLACERAVRALDLVVGGVRRDAEQRVEVGHRRGSAAEQEPAELLRHGGDRGERLLVVHARRAEHADGAGRLAVHL